eukprot:1609644-Rhodomonas_salina.1
MHKISLQEPYQRAAGGYPSNSSWRPSLQEPYQRAAGQGSWRLGTRVKPLRTEGLWSDVPNNSIPRISPRMSTAELEFIRTLHGSMIEASHCPPYQAPHAGIQRCSTLPNLPLGLAHRSAKDVTDQRKSSSPTGSRRKSAVLRCSRRRSQELTLMYSGPQWISSIDVHKKHWDGTDSQSDLDREASGRSTRVCSFSSGSETRQCRDQQIDFVEIAKETLDPLASTPSPKLFESEFNRIFDRWLLVGVVIVYML